MPLTHEQRQRFERNIALPEIGEKGQERLLAARVLVVGAGGLGSPAALYLAAAGIGFMTIMDGDDVELGNLQRQILHSTPDIGRRKTESAVARLSALNPQLNLKAIPERLTTANGLALVMAHDFVIDATDNFESKFLVANLCHAGSRPYCHGGIVRFTGQAMTVIPGNTACYRCVFDGPPVDNHATAPEGPLGPLPGIIGAVQAAEALKHLLSLGGGLLNRMLTLNLLEMKFRCVKLARNPRCPLCGTPARPM